MPEAQAGNYNVGPIPLVIDRDHRTTLLTITNLADEELRLEITTYLWDQQGDDPKLLTPTSDVQAFPSLIVMPPHDVRKVRVGLTTSLTDVEQSYRVLVAELPPLANDGSVGVRMLTRNSIPIFVAPIPKETFTGELTDVRAHTDGVRFSAHSTGNAHVMVTDLKLRATRADGSKLEAASTGWYVLPGRSRPMMIPLPPGECERLTAVELRAVTDHGDWTIKTQVDPTTCAPPPAPVASPPPAPPASPPATPPQ